MLVNDTNNDVGSRFRLIRGSMKQIDFAKLINVNRSYVAQIETNGNKPSIDYLTKVAQKFNVSIDWLLLELIEKLLEEKQEWVLLEAIATLSKNKMIDDLQSYIAEQPDDPVLNEMIKYLKSVWYRSDEKMKNWLEIQFQKCFPDYLDELQKKLYDFQDDT
jgi:transcriptional regulator with XRE-family HTH domain